jgi:MraZ protein
MPDAPLLLGTIPLVLGADPVRLPDAFLRPFVDGGVMTLWLDGCVALWPPIAWATIARRIADLPLANADARAFARVVFASAVPFGPESVAPSPALRAAASIDDEGEAVLVGAGDRAELWSRERWDAVARLRLDDLAAALGDAPV